MGLLPLLLGGAVGYALLQRARWHHSQRMLDLQSEEILYSNNELEKKFRDLETTIEQLSLLSELAAAVSATLDAEKIYEQTLERLVHAHGIPGRLSVRRGPGPRASSGVTAWRGRRGRDRGSEAMEFSLDDPRAG